MRQSREGYISFELSEQAIIAHLGFLQNIISRMNSNCTQCKIACVTLTGALLTVLSTVDIKNSVSLLFTLIFIQILFCYFDSRYLATEHYYRNQYDELVNEWKEKKLSVQKVFCIMQPEISLKLIWGSFVTWSVCPLYTGIIILSITIFFVKQGILYKCIKGIALILKDMNYLPI